MSLSGLDACIEPLALGLQQLREDAQYARIAPQRRMALVEAALDDGRSLADRTRDRWGKDPIAIAAHCNVPVIRSASNANFGSVIVYAEYASRPPSITLYLPAIRRLDDLVAKDRGGIARGIASTLPVFLAHELYHHFDCLRGSGRLSRRHDVTIFSLGSWRWTSGLSSLCEIAAGAYAQHLLGLPFHPRLLDRLSIDHAPARTAAR